LKRLVVFGKNKKATATVYFILRFLVILTMIFQFLRGNYENVFMCVLTLILFFTNSIARPFVKPNNAALVVA